jgi:hypothetical protein
VVENLGTTAKLVLSCGRKDLRSHFNRPLTTEFLENCRELSTRAVENSRTLREEHETGYPILRLRLFLLPHFLWFIGS